MNQDKYTDPKLRENIKAKLHKGDKGGASGQWSARKSQMLAAEYKKQGGGYTKDGEKTGSQKSLDKWTDEKWTTQDGDKAVGKKTTKRYLPKKAWDALSPSEKKATETKKRSGSKAGEQFVDNTPKAKKARKKVAKKASKKAGGRKATGKKSTSKAGKKVGKKASKKAGKKVSKKAGKKVSKKAGKKVSKKAGKKTSKKAGKKAGRKVGKKTAGKRGRPAKK